MATVTLSQLSRTYGPYKAVDGLNLVIRDGEFISFLGPAGCGKTTALRLIAGLVDPSGGSVAIDGRVVSSPKGSVPPERRGMAMLFHSIALWPHLSVAANVAFGLQQRQVPAAEIARRTGRALDIAGVRTLAERRPSQLKAEQQQRVALARALVVEPAVLLLDEALAAADASRRAALGADIRRVQVALGLTIVSVTGDAAEAMAVSDRIAIMHQGRIEQIDTPGALYMRPETRLVAELMGPTNLIVGRRVGKRLVFDGFSIEAGRLGDVPADTVTVSLRPEHLQLTTPEVEAPAGTVGIAGQIAQRTFGGAHWHYRFETSGAEATFDVTTPAAEIFAAGQAAQLIVDPGRMVCVR